MKKFENFAMQAAVVAAGVAVAGYVMYQFRENAYVKQIQAGIRG